MSPGLIGMAGVYQISPERRPASMQPSHAGVKCVVPMFQRTDDLRITAGPAAHSAGHPARRDPDQRTGVERRRGHARVVAERDRRAATRGSSSSSGPAPFTTRRRRSSTPSGSSAGGPLRRAPDRRDAQLLREAAHVGRLEGPHQRSGSGRELSHQQGAPARAQPAARRQRPGTADGVRVPRHADSPAHRRPDLVGGDRRADDREPGAPRARLGAVDAGRDSRTARTATRRPPSTRCSPPARRTGSRR